MEDDRHSVLCADDGTWLVGSIIFHADAIHATIFGVMETNFTQGGLNKFEEEGGRDGYYGWFGYGGSVFQWHPDLRIGFGYTPTLLHWQSCDKTFRSRNSLGFHKSKYHRS